MHWRIGVILFTNQLLIAMPSLNDDFFYKGVVYVCQHSEEGAIGIMINQPTDFKLKTIFEQLEIKITIPDMANDPVLFGGPVQQDKGFVIHRPSEDMDASLLVSENVSISTSKESLSTIARGNGPADVLVALGYAAWGANQLDQEIQENTWLNCPATQDLLYNTAFEDRWVKAIESIGFDLDQLVSDSGHA